MGTHFEYLPEDKAHSIHVEMLEYLKSHQRPDSYLLLSPESDKYVDEAIKKYVAAGNSAPPLSSF